ncbi:MAG TPA: sugar transferase [Candidatus Polarisedimenticolia bacterium]|nr:sugar transferase [Candidatus Polarisedimenticolia bacterium]
MTGSGRGRAYCRGPLKRALDLSVSALALAVFAPLLLLAALLVLLTSGRPVLFRQERIGLEGRRFRILKFRTMRDGPGGTAITGAGDRRITPAGALLRASKIDELPQFFNVLKGDMAIVGPRPEIPRFVAGYSAAERRVLDVRPGLTDLATLAYRDEERLLGTVAEGDRERFYASEVLPKKLLLNLQYVERASLREDLAIVLRTAAAIVLPERR